MLRLISRLMVSVHGLFHPIRKDFCAQSCLDQAVHIGLHQDETVILGLNWSCTGTTEALQSRVDQQPLTL